MAKAFFATAQGGNRGFPTAGEERDELQDALQNGQNATGAKAYHFPQDLSKLDHWMAIRIAKHNLLQKNDFAEEETLEYIFLPVPANLGTQYTQSWNTDDLGHLGVQGAKFGRAFAKGGVSGILESAVQRIETTALSDIKSKTAKFMGYYGVQAAEQAAVAIGAMAYGVAGGILGAASGKFVKGSIAGAGVARNPYNALLYENPAFRAHTFQWKFIARNSAEVEMLRVVIERLKLAQSPSLNGKNPHFFDYPESQRSEILFYNQYLIFGNLHFLMFQK